MVLFVLFEQSCEVLNWPLPTLAERIDHLKRSVERMLALPRARQSLITLLRTVKVIEKRGPGPTGGKDTCPRPTLPVRKAPTEN